MTAGAEATGETVLVLDVEFERRIVAAARVVGVDPAEFIVRALQQHVAVALGEKTAVRGSAGSTHPSGEGAAEPGDAVELAPEHQAHRPWAIRTTRSIVLRSVAEATGLTVETIVGPGRTSQAAQARAVAAYLLRNDAGLSALDTARTLHRKRPTLHRLIAGLEEVMGSTDPRGQLLERTRRLFKNGLSSGKTYPPLPFGTAVAKLLPGLLACRLAAELTQPELAERAGIARETLARLERLRRRARPETVDALAQALGASRHTLTAATEELSGIRTPARNAQPSARATFARHAQVGDGRW